MKRSDYFKAEIAKLSADSETITAAAAKDGNRKLTDDELKRMSEIDAAIIDSEKQLDAALTAERIQARRQKADKERDVETGAPVGAPDKADPPEAPASRSFTIPASARKHGNLKAYDGPEGERDAYVAGQVILAGIFGNAKATTFCREHGLIQNVQTTGDNSKGGFLVPDEMQRALIRLRESHGVFPQFANRIPMGSDLLRVPRMLSDVSANWVGEQQEIPSSEFGLGLAELMARKLAALVKVSSELDEDAIIDIGDMITTSMAYAMAFKIDDAAFNGDGTSQYGGTIGMKNALHSNARIVAESGNTGVKSLDLSDWEAVIGAYPQYPGASPRWFMHSAVYYNGPFDLMNSAGGNTNITLANGVSQPMLLGYPVTFVQTMPSEVGAAVSTLPAIFGDLRLGASYGVRRQVRTEVSTERYFEHDLIGIKQTERIAILIHETGETINTRPILALQTAPS